VNESWGLGSCRYEIEFEYGIPGLGILLVIIIGFSLSCIIIKYFCVGGIIVIFFIEPPLKISFVFVLVEKALFSQFL